MDCQPHDSSRACGNGACICVTGGTATTRDCGMKKKLPVIRGGLVAVELLRNAFNHAVFRGGWDDSRQPKSGMSQEIAVLVVRSFLSTRSDQHREIKQFGEARLVARWNYGFDNEDPPAWRHGSANVFQNADRSFFILIVNDVAQNIDDGTGGSGFEEVPFDQMNAIRQPGFFDDCIGPLDHAGKVEQRAFQIRMPS